MSLPLNEIQSLFEHGEYEKVLAGVADATEGKPLLYGLASLLALRKEEEALAYIALHREALFKANARKVLEATMSLRIARKEWDLAKKDYELFASLPYQSQEVEEILRSVPKALEDAKAYSEKPEEKTLSEIRAVLKGKDENAILEALHSLSKEDFPAFEKEILSLLTDPAKNLQTRSFALLYLKSVGYEKEVAYLGPEGERRYVPALLPTPFFNARSKEGLASLAALQDRTLGQTAKKLAEILEIVLYPESPFEGSPEDLPALLMVAQGYLEEGEAAYPIEKPFDLPKAKQKATLWKRILEEAPPLGD